MNTWIRIASAVTAIVVGQAAAEPNVDMAAGQALVRKSPCISCHEIDKRIIGPAFKEIAAKYKGDKTAEARLVKKVTKGGAGVWGQIPMPANSQVKPEDIKTLVQWVLAQ